MWYAINKFMKWDMPSRIYDVVWNDNWSLKYGLCTYMRTIPLNVNWQLCDKKNEMKHLYKCNAIYEFAWIVIWCELSIWMV